MSRVRVVFSIGAMHGGGSERQLVSLLRYLDRSRFEPYLYLVYRSGPLLKFVPEDVPVTSFDERVTASSIYLPGLMHRRRVADFADFLKQIRADVSYDRTFLMTLISAAGAQRAGVPNVSTVVTNPEIGFAPVAGRFQWFKRRMLHRLYSKSSRVLSVSEGARQAAIRFYGIPPEKIMSLPNGVDLQLLRQQSLVEVEDPWWNQQADQDARGSGIRRIVTAGRLNEQKGFHFLIQAIAELRSRHSTCDVRLAIFGEGPWRDRLLELIQRLELSDHVHLMGFSDAAAAWYRTADLFVLPSLMEGSPNVLLEAMALGTAVISTDCPSGPRELLRGGDLGRLVPVANPAALADSIDEALTKTEQTQQMVQKAQQAVESDFSIEVACRRLEKVLGDAAGKSLKD